MRLFVGEIPGLLLSVFLAAAASTSAADLRGTVTNGTTKKPAAGDDVLLLATSRSTENEIAHAKTDSAGRFTFSIADAGRSDVVRVLHQGVAYDEIASPNGDFVTVQVYDVAADLDGVAAIMDVQRFETKGDTLEVKQLVTMRNGSKPPRTLMNDRPFPIQLPPDAQVQSGLIQIEEGQPLRQKPTPGDQPGDYYFHSPLRPGDSRFAVVYRLPYKGEATIEPRIRNAHERFVVMLPKSMAFEPQAKGVFLPMPDVSADNVQGTAPVTPGQVLAFRITGTGTLAELQRQLQTSPSGHLQMQPAAQVDREVPISPGTSLLDDLVVSGVSGGLLVFCLVIVAKRKARVPFAVERGVPSAQGQGGQIEARHRHHVRVSRHYSRGNS